MNEWCQRPPGTYRVGLQQGTAHIPGPWELGEAYRMELMLGDSKVCFGRCRSFLDWVLSGNRSNLVILNNVYLGDRRNREGFELSLVKKQ